MDQTFRQLGLVVSVVGVLVGALLVAVGAPVWAFYAAPVVTIPVMLAALGTPPNETASVRLGSSVRRKHEPARSH